MQNAMILEIHSLVTQKEKTKPKTGCGITKAF